MVLYDINQLLSVYFEPCITNVVIIILLIVEPNVLCFVGSFSSKYGPETLGSGYVDVRNPHSG